MWITLVFSAPPASIYLVYGRIQRTIPTKHTPFNDQTLPFCMQNFWIYSFCSILYGIFTINSLFPLHCDTEFSAYTLWEKLLWIQLFWMKKMKFYCICVHEKYGSEIKCIVLYSCAAMNSWICKYKYLHTVPMFICWYLPNINPMVAIGVFCIQFLLKFYVKFN